MEVEMGGLDSFHLPVASYPASSTSTTTPTSTSTPTTSTASPTTSTSVPSSTSAPAPSPREDPVLTPLREEQHFYTALRKLLEEGNCRIKHPDYDWRKRPAGSPP